MALLPNGQFDANQHADMLSFDPIPEDWYPCMMIESDYKQTKDYQTNGHQFLECKFVVNDGPFKGRFLWTRLNIINSSAQAVEIANRELATICRSVGIPAAQDSAQLHNIPLMVKAKLVPASSEYPAKNEISGYKTATGAAAAPAPVAAPAPAPAPTAAPAPVAAPAPAPMAPAPVAPAPVVTGAPGSPQPPVAVPPAAAPAAVAPAPIAPAPAAPVPVTPGAAPAPAPAAPPWK